MTIGLIIFTVFLLLTIPVAHITGYFLARSKNVAHGHIREVMPSLPSAPSKRGRMDKRWDKSMKRIEAKLLDMFKNGAQGVQHIQLAGQLNESPDLVEAVLARMREEIPCRMRILRSGTILHDFKAEDIQRLKRQKQLSKPRQALIAVLAAFANIGAAWPFISLVIVVLATFSQMTGMGSEGEMASVGIIGIGLSMGIIVVTLVASLFAQLIFAPPFLGPKLGKALAKEKLPERRLPRYHDDPTPLIFIDSATPNLFSSSSSSWGSSSSSSSSGSSFDFDMDDAEGEGALLILVIIVLVAILGAALSIIWVWLRGIWRAVARLDEPPLSTSPTLWVRTEKAMDKWERFLPTNDLVIRTLHAIKRQMDYRRPPDDDLPARILILAKQKNNVLTGLDIAFHEGLDLNEAHEIGARLAGILDGQILLDNEGELAFAFPPKALEKLSNSTDRDLWAEYISFSGDMMISRRESQPKNSVLVNLVGLTYSHIVSLTRLVAGTYLMAVMGAMFIASLGIGSIFINMILMGLPLLMVLATATLMTTSYYLAKINAEHGIRRDIRRATFKWIHSAIARGEDQTTFNILTKRLVRVFKPAWSSLDEDIINKEIQGVVIDLELEPLATSSDISSLAYDLSTLRRRLQEDQTFARVFDFEQVAFDFEGQTDEVVFDTEIQHDHVTSLG